MSTYSCTEARRPGKFHMGGTGAQSVGRVVKKISEATCYGGLGAGFPVAPCSRWIPKMTRMYRTQPRADGERRPSRDREVPNGERACYLVAVPWFCDSHDSDRGSFPQLIDTGAASSEAEYAGQNPTLIQLACGDDDGENPRFSASYSYGNPR